MGRPEAAWGSARVALLAAVLLVAIARISAETAVGEKQNAAAGQQAAEAASTASHSHGQPDYNHHHHERPHHGHSGSDPYHSHYGDKGCTANPSVSDGVFNCKLPAPLHSTCTGMCESGSGTLVATCKWTGIWVVDNHCIPAETQCTGNPTDPLNGSGSFDSCGATTAIDGTCEGACAAGYTGTLQATCTATGWVVDNQCQLAQCTGNPTDPSNGSGSFDSCGATTAIDGTCEGACAAGYTGTLQATCTATGWDVVNQCVEETIQCTNEPTDPTGGFFSGCGVTAIGESCDGFCSIGWTGTLSATCSGADSWTVNDQCTEDVAVCGNDGDNCDATVCCTGLFCDAYGDDTCCNGLAAYGDACNNGADCCTGNCYLNPDPDGGSDYCVPSGGRRHSVPALSGATLIHTLESSTPIALRDLKTGQHVPCLGSLQDLAPSGRVSWCEVKNFLVAAPEGQATFEVSVATPDGGQQTLKTAARQLVYILAGANHTVDAKMAPPALETPGAYTVQTARNLRDGDRVLMKAKPSDPSASAWVLGTVKNTRDVKAPTSKQHTKLTQGFYKPVIDAPYMLVGGLLLPMFDKPMGHVPKELARDATLAQHQLLAPLYTQALQPAGTPAHKATWGTGNTIWESWSGIAAHITEVATSQPVDDARKELAAIHAWFSPLHKAYVDSKAAVPVSKVEEILSKRKKPAEVKPAADAVAGQAPRPREVV